MSDKIERKNIDWTKIDWNEHAQYWDDFDEAKDYTKKIFKLLSDRVNIENMTILDFGCGTGLLTDHMSKEASQIIAIDSAEKMIDVLNEKNYKNVKTLVGELSDNIVEQVPELQNKFDLIVAASVCAFLPNYEEVLATIKSLLAPNGIFVQWDWLRSEKDPDFGFTEQMIRDSYSLVRLKIDSIEIPFYVLENDEKMEVLMAIGKL